MLPRKRNRLKAYAAVALVNSCNSVETTATPTLLAANRQNGNASPSRPYGSVVTGSGTIEASTLDSWTSPVSDVATIHRNGPTMARAPRLSAV